MCRHNLFRRCRRGDRLGDHVVSEIKSFGLCCPASLFDQVVQGCAYFCAPRSRCPSFHMRVLFLSFSVLVCRDGWLGSVPVGVSVFRVYMVWCFDCFGELGGWDFVFPVLAGDPNLYVRM